jgi:hypothetical protein
VPPTIRYAHSGDLSIAYEVGGEGELDLVLLVGFVAHLEWMRQEPSSQRFRDRLASFSRLLAYDPRFTERGTRTLRGVPGSWPLFAVA